jgi:hypothetical protein
MRPEQLVHERGNDRQPHVYFHDSFDNEISEKVDLFLPLSGLGCEVRAPAV